MPSLRAIAAAMIGLSAPTRVGAMLRGLSLPTDEGQARSLLTALGGVGNEIERGVRLYRKARTGALRTDDPVRGPGRIVSELDETDALRLEVHPAIVVGAERTVLPPYLPRAHDTRLREAVTAARTSSAAVMLVGGSSTGKTRACWEAVREVLPDWRLWHPLTPERPDAVVAALAGGRVQPRTVIWLNEAQMYLAPSGNGPRVAAALQDLLSRDEPGPVLVLGSMWPEHWNGLTERDAGRDHPARTFLGLCRAIAVPAGFEPDELDRQSATIGSDPRLRIAAAQGGRRLTQHLAGAPELVRRFEHAGEPARALVQAAMDARRLGGQLYLSPEFLRHAASGYLDRQVWDQLPDGDSWFTEAMAYLMRPCHGAPGPFTRRKPLPGETAPAAGFRLADFLEQVGRADRAAVFPPASFWDAVESTVVDPGILREFALQAQNRGRLQRAVRLYETAVGRGDKDALHRAVFLRHRHGDEAGAETLAMRALDCGDTSGVVALAGWRESANWPSAEALYRLAADRGNPRAVAALAESWRRIHPHDFAAGKALAVRAAEGGVTRGLRGLAEWCDQRGAAGEAEALAQLAADHGDPGVLVTLADARRSAGLRSLALRAEDSGNRRRFLALARLYLATRSKSARVRDLERAWKAAEQGDVTALIAILRRDLHHGDLDDAERLYRQAAAAGSTKALCAVATLRTLGGDPEGAEQATRAAADRGDHTALVGLADARLRAGDRDGALTLYEKAYAHEVPFALARLTRLRVTRDPERALVLATGSADRGDTMPLIALALHREHSGDTAGAEALYRQVLDRGDRRAASRLINLREGAGDHDGATAIAVRAAMMGWVKPLADLAESRDKAGDHAGAEVLAARAAAHGEPSALRNLAWRRAQAGDQDGARRLRRQAAGHGDTSAMLALADELRTAGDPLTAEKILIEAVNRGAAYSAFTGLARLRSDAGDSAAARLIHRYGLSDDGTPARSLPPPA
ncbi:hypothetical protein ACIBPB_11670 [Micromonospora sp. NPDC049836]|uniref:hypothetical protein n=1 Tax=Micromonospora sp. NPDC049836 TaxID=3364274 RepID=UPI0037AE8013